jgi:endonuclease/exonuclease/phosphatase (EEP) superfamily protein YafD
LVIALSWSVVAALLAVTSLHLAHSEPWTIVVGLIAVTPWIYMLAWVTTSIGLFFRRRVLAATSAILVLFQLWWVVPDFDPIGHLASLVPGNVQITLLDANVSQANRNLSQLAAEIRRDRPQVVTLEEVKPASLHSLALTHVMDLYRFSMVKLASGSDSMAMWSVFPLEDASEWSAAGHPELRAWLELPGHQRLRIDVLHTNAPYGPGQLSLWIRQIVAIKQELAREPRPLVAVGDLNATWYDWHFQALLHLGLRDAAVVAGQGWRMTWPRDQQPVVPYLRIDHVLLSPAVALYSYRVSADKGSDHDSLRVTIALGGR